jgi:hypothetical protein
MNRQTIFVCPVPDSAIKVERRFMAIAGRATVAHAAGSVGPRCRWANADMKETAN